MVIKRDAQQCLVCTICGEDYEFRGRQIDDSEEKLLQEQRMREEHKPCEEWAHDPRRAKLERKFRRNLQAEQRRKSREMERAAKA